MSELSASNPSTLLTVRDVATWLRVHPKTVYAWAARQVIPTVKIQGALRFRREDLTAFVEACLVKEPNGQPTLTRPRPSQQPDIPAVVARVKRLVHASSNH